LRPDWYREIARQTASHALSATVTPSRPLVDHFLSTKTEGGALHRSSTLCSADTFAPAKRCFKRPSTSCLKRVDARSRRGTSTPYSPPSGASFFVGPAPWRRGTPQAQHVSPLCLVPASGLRGLLFGTFAPRPMERNVLAMLAGAVGGGILRNDYCRL
jgi:hypothetical protein